MPKAWHMVGGENQELPEPGERVLICIGNSLVGEGYIKTDGLWYRYCDLGPVDQYMNAKVTAWMEMPKPPSYK